MNQRGEDGGKGRPPERGSLSFIDHVVSKAEQMAPGTEADLRDDSPASTVRRQLSLTLSQLRRLDGVREGLERQLVRLECYLETEGMQMEARTPRYSPYRFPEREKIQRRLQRVGEERRRLEQRHDEQRRSLEERLLSLLEQMLVLSEET